MFTSSDFSRIDRKYFQVLSFNGFSVTLQSKNTGHFWHITFTQYGSQHSYEVSHKHRYEDAYHKHNHARSFKGAMRDIKDHDAYYLRKQKDREYRRRARMAKKAERKLAEQAS